MRQRAAAKILAGGTYEWSQLEPGEECPPHDETVAKAWALASRRLGTNYPLLTEHAKYVSLIYHYISLAFTYLFWYQGRYHCYCSPAAYKTPPGIAGDKHLVV
jgi:hypothetical protein